MEPNKLYEEIVNERREKLKKFLLECSHYDKDRLIRGAKNRAIFGNNQDDEQVYHSLVQFATFHNIKIHTEEPKISIKNPTENAFIEEIDGEGNVTLKKLGEDEIKDSNNFIQVLEKERDRLSEKLLKINNLIRIYNG